MCLCLSVCVCVRDCLITVVVNCFTSLFAGFVIFTFLGYMSVRDNLDMEHVATDGNSLTVDEINESIIMTVRV